MYIADLHIHSRYSRATSKEGTPEHLDLWARRKGIHIVGTGDFTHPAWREELKEKLVPAQDGLYTLKEEYRITDAALSGGALPGEITPRFVVTGEISSIYKKNGKVRKVHSVIILPGLEDAERISNKLEQIGNIHSDGRPILGLDCHDLLEIVLELCPRAVYVPAHIWTPHFSLFGAFSGFDTVEECFEDLTPYIHAMETGLSSDPPMNWRISALDKYQLISNSDAHSPAKLGREANLFDIPMSYEGLAHAIQTGEGLYGTIEFFPEEGKYHMDGHRKCNLCLTPSDTIKYNGVCPVCGRKITVGVSHRVEELADRAEGYVRENAKAFESLVPLPEVIGACTGRSAASKKVQKEYIDMLAGLGAEFEILREVPLDDIRRVSGTRMAEGIGRLRNGEVERIPGFDGEYGVIKLFSAEELSNTEGQMSFFDVIGAAAAEDQSAADRKAPGSPAAAEQKAKGSRSAGEECAQGKDKETVLNPEQERTVHSTALRIAVKAGPGTGKTKTLVSRLKYLIENRKVRPSEITAVTFTNQAAEEMRDRIRRETGRQQAGRALQIGTFHSICLNFLKAGGAQFSLITEGEAKKLAEDIAAKYQISLKPKEFLEMVSRRKSGIAENAEQEETAEISAETADISAAERREGDGYEEAYRVYESLKAQKALYDFDDLLLKTAECIEKGEASEGWEKCFRYLLVDEFQDINPIQHRLVKLWSQAGQELFVIGDPDQSIYGFRGADADCFDRLEREYDGLEVIELKENYRSSPQIVAAAAAVISHNPGKERNIHANCETNIPVRIVRCAGMMGEAIFIAKEINRQAGGIGMLEAHEAAWERGERKTRGFGDIAVLYRTHRQAGLLEKCLRKEGIPYIVAGREEFLKEPSVQGSICFFRCLEDKEDILAKRECAEHIWKLEWNQVTEQIIDETAEKYRPLYSRKKPRKFLEQWMEEMSLTEDTAMQKLLQMTVFYKTMPEFRTALELGVESDLKRCGGKQYTSEAVTLMTLHGSKGLEFPVTFIYGTDQGMIPLKSEKTPTDKEEERRLFYVGMTRAKEELILTTSGEESEFIGELPEEVKREEAVKKKKEETCRQMSLFEL